MRTLPFLLMATLSLSCAFAEEQAQVSQRLTIFKETDRVTCNGSGIRKVADGNDYYCNGNKVIKNSSVDLDLSSEREGDRAKLRDYLIKENADSCLMKNLNAIREMRHHENPELNLDHLLSNFAQQVDLDQMPPLIINDYELSRQGVDRDGKEINLKGASGSSKRLKIGFIFAAGNKPKKVDGGSADRLSILDTKESECQVVTFEEIKKGLDNISSDHLLAVEEQENVDAILNDLASLPQALSFSDLRGDSKVDKSERFDREEREEEEGQSGNHPEKALRAMST